MKPKVILIGLTALFLLLVIWLVLSPNESLWRVPPEEPNESLKEVAQAHDIEVGVAVHPSRFDDPHLANTVSQEFSSVTLGSACATTWCDHKW